MKTLFDGTALAALLFPVEVNAGDNSPVPLYDIEHDCGTDDPGAPPIAQACITMEHYYYGRLSMLDWQAISPAVRKDCIAAVEQSGNCMKATTLYNCVTSRR